MKSSHSNLNPKPYDHVVSAQTELRELKSSLGQLHNPWIAARAKHRANETKRVSAQSKLAVARDKLNAAHSGLVVAQENLSAIEVECASSEKLIAKIESEQSALRDKLAESERRLHAIQEWRSRELSRAKNARATLEHRGK